MTHPTDDIVPNPTVAVVDEAGLDPTARLARALERCGAWAALATAAHGARVAPAGLKIVILPELGAFATGSPAATDPVLVEALIDLLHDSGFSSVVVAGGADGSARWAANRTVYALTDLLGYRFVTPGGRDYDIIDLGDDLVAAPFHPGEVLYGSLLSRTWFHADFRIVFAANSTDEADGYALGLHTALAALQPGGSVYLHLAAHLGDLVAELVRTTPVQLTLIDAIVSCHGSAGRRAPKPITTECIIASTDIWLADTVGAIKMGLDPAVSPLMARCPRICGTVGDVVVDGGLAVYEGWTSPHPLILDSARRRDESPWWSRLLRPWLQVLDPALFPLESPLDARMNERIAPWFADVDEDPLALSALVFANTALGGFQKAVEGYRVLYAKDEVHRVSAPLGFDPATYPPDAYAVIVPELTGLERLIAGTPERAPGLRWRYLDEAVLFLYSREIPVDFDEFVASVDVSRAISYMNDYIGGVVVPVEHDGSGRPVRQAERNLYLPQPNYLVLSGGRPIDVSKLEIVEYDDGVHRMYWKTIASENDSAVYDDGIVTFARTETGTAVTIFGRQLFVLPPLWAAIDLGLIPDQKELLVTHAYVTFFDRTLANLEALTEGRDIRIGRGRATAGAVAEPLPAADVEKFFEGALTWLGTVSDTVRGPGGNGRQSSTPIYVDSDGFSHFEAPHPAPLRPPVSTAGSAAADFWAGLFQAGLRDLPGLAGASPR
jgi:uncharacterized protein (DUF362 family)